MSDPQRAPAAVVGDVLEERGLRSSTLRALLALLEHDACWGCVPGTPAWASNEHAHALPDRALAVFFAARAARTELHAVVDVLPRADLSGQAPGAVPAPEP